MKEINRRRFIRDSILSITTACISEPLLNEMIDEVIKQEDDLGLDIQTINFNDIVTKTLHANRERILQNMRQNNALYAKLMERVNT